MKYLKTYENYAESDERPTTLDGYTDTEYKIGDIVLLPFQGNDKLFKITNKKPIFYYTLTNLNTEETKVTKSIRRIATPKEIENHTIKKSINKYNI